MHNLEKLAIKTAAAEGRTIDEHVMHPSVRIPKACFHMRCEPWLTTTPPSLPATPSRKSNPASRKCGSSEHVFSYQGLSSISPRTSYPDPGYPTNDQNTSSGTSPASANHVHKCQILEKPYPFSRPTQQRLENHTGTDSRNSRCLRHSRVFSS